MDADHALGAPPGYRFEDLAADGYYVTAIATPASSTAWRSCWPTASPGATRACCTNTSPRTSRTGSSRSPGPWVHDVPRRRAQPRSGRPTSRTPRSSRRRSRRSPANARYAYYLAQSLQGRRRARARARGLSSARDDARLGRGDVACPLPGGAAGRAPRRLAGGNRARLPRSVERAAGARRAAGAARALASRRGGVAAGAAVRAHGRGDAAAGDQLFVEDAVYAWRALDELAIAAWHAGARDEGRVAAQRLVAEGRFPGEPSASGSRRTAPWYAVRDAARHGTARERAAIMARAAATPGRSSDP